MFGDLDITGGDMCNLLGLSSQQVTEPTKRGVLIRAEKRHWSLIKSVRTYAEHMRQIAKGNQGTNLNLADERALLAQAQRKETELRTKARYGDFVPISAVADKWAGIARNVRQNILACPDKIALRIPGLHPAEKAAIEQILLDALQACADGEQVNAAKIDE